MGGNEKMNRRTIMGVPAGCFLAVIAVCLAGIILGSFRDFDIMMALNNKTDLGNYFSTFSPILAYAMLPAGGACLFVGLKKKKDSYKPMAWILLIFSCFMAVFYSNQYYGVKLRPMLGYTAGESPAMLSVACWLVWVAVYAWCLSS